MTRSDLERLLAGVSVGRLVEIVGWDADPVVDTQRERGNPYEIEHSLRGWLITCRFRRPDRDSNVVSIGEGRPWWVGTEFSEEQVVRTAYSAVRMLVEHELLEFFCVAGVRLFDPHERGTAHGETSL